MPYKNTYLEDGGVRIDYEGIVTLTETRKAEESVYFNSTHPISKVPFIIEDYSKVEKFDFPFKELRESARADAEILENNPDLLMAVVSYDDLVFGMARAWKSVVGEEEERTQIFRNYEAAEIWIKKKMAKK